MICICGFNYAKNCILNEPRAVNSYAVIADKDYYKLMKKEVAVFQAKGRDAKSKAIGAASKYVGSLMECPDCGRLTIYRDNNEEYEHFKRVKHAKPPKRNA